MMGWRAIGAGVLTFALMHVGAAQESRPERVSIEVHRDADKTRVDIRLGENIFAQYHSRDEGIHRPFFSGLRTLDGVQVTRNHPPAPGDLDDHPTMHPGAWLAFGDISGSDFWRNRARVEQGILYARGTPGRTSARFGLENLYVDAGRELCREITNYRVTVFDDGWLLESNHSFSPLFEPIVFGDQEEMGFGVRVATPMAVNRGGQIHNSEGGIDEEGVWGQQAAWATYSGEVDGKRVAITLMPHPDNFRESWFHARNYGLLLANPFGRNAFTRGEESAIEVKPGELFRLRFGLFVHNSVDDPAEAGRAAYDRYLRAEEMRREAQQG